MKAFVMDKLPDLQRPEEAVIPGHPQQDCQQLLEPMLTPIQQAPPRILLSIMLPTVERQAMLPLPLNRMTMHRLATALLPFVKQEAPTLYLFLQVLQEVRSAALARPLILLPE